MKTGTKSKPLPPIRVRWEPPTIDEAVVAAQGLTDDLQQQAEIAAGLMGVSEDDVRPHVISASRKRASVETLSYRATPFGSRRTVVVEHRNRPRSNLPPRGAEHRR
jgi:hypothetical protein